MTDKEIIKALECCITYEFCTGCPLVDNCPSSYSLLKLALDLIKRQQAEIERLKARYEKLLKAKEQIEADGSQTIQSLCAEIRTLEKTNKDYTEEGNRLILLIPKARAEAVKEFAERLKEEFRVNTDNNGDINSCLVPIIIDNLVKEMVGEDNG